MRVGLASDADGPPAATEARTAEAAGFSHYAVGEHVFFHGPTENAFVALATAATATSSIRLLSCITLLPLYPAALATKMAVALDRASGGRFDFGVGAGGEFEREFRACGVPVDTRFRRLDEALRVYQQLCTGEAVSFTGEFADLDKVSLQPLPVQRPHPPIWVAGRQAGSMRRAARVGAAWMPYMVSPGRLAQGMSTIAEECERVGRTAREVSGAMLAWICVDDDEAWARRTAIATLAQTYHQNFTDLADHILLVGTPAQVLERLAEYSRAGLQDVILGIAARGDDRGRVLGTIAAEVLPLASAL